MTNVIERMINFCQGIYSRFGCYATLKNCRPETTVFYKPLSI